MRLLLERLTKLCSRVWLAGVYFSRQKTRCRGHGKEQLALGLACLIAVSSQCGAQETTSPADSVKLPFKVSRETTYITEPLTEEGLPDYRAVLNQMMKKGITPETNAAVYYWRAIGPHPDGFESEMFVTNLIKELGTDPFSTNGTYLMNFNQAVEELRKENKLEIPKKPIDEYYAALDGPWKSDDYPSVKKWIDLNQKPLEIVLKGTQQPHYFRPVVKAEEKEYLVATRLSDLNEMRELARMLNARALLAIAEERYKNASRDLIAMHRLARHVGQGASVIEILVSIAIDTIARYGDLQLANAKTVTVKQLKAHQKRLAELPTLAHCEQAFVTERFVALDVVLMIATINPKLKRGQAFLSMAGLDLSSSMGQFATTLFQHRIDWNFVMTGINDYYDKIDDAISEDSFAKRYKTLQQLSEELQAEVEQTNRPAALRFSSLFSPQRRGNHLRLVLLPLWTPPLEQYVVAQTRGNSNAPLTETAFAVSAYHKREGKLPDNLQQLVPGDLAEIPLDPFTGQPVHYLLKGNEAIIYCLGKNLQDDGGVTQQENREQYDIVVRIQKQEPVKTN